MTRVPTSPVTQRQPPLRDRKWLDSAEGRPCDICGAEGTTVFCHDRRDQSGGMGMKPDDRLGFFGCDNCHREQEANHETTEVWEQLTKKLIAEMCVSEMRLYTVYKDIRFQRSLMIRRHDLWRAKR